MKSLAELKALRDKALEAITMRTDQDMTRIVIGMATCGIASGAREVMATLIEEIEVREIKAISVQPTGCMGMCALEPMLEIHRSGEAPVTYVALDAQKVKRIVHEHLVNGQVVSDYVIGKYI